LLFTYTRIILYNTSKPPGSVVPMFLGCVWRSKMQRAYCNSRIWHPWRGSLLVGHSILIWFFYCTLQIEAITSKKSSLLNDCVEANPRLCSFIHSRKNMDTCWRTAWNPETSGWLGSKNSRQSSQGLLWGLKSKWYEELCSLQGAGYMLSGASRIHLPDGGQNRFKFRKISRPVKTWSLPQIHASSMANLEVSSTCVARVYMFMLICMFWNKPRCFWLSKWW
jgi:hypothetical protein